jgi:putative restriction endonuclease
MGDHEDKSAISAAHARIEKLNTWRRNGVAAPHKPLLLLLALSRVQQGEPRLVEFTEIESPLRDLLEQFGPQGKHVHPEYPFWRLQRDGLWEVADAESFPTRRSNTDPPVSALRNQHAKGGFPAPLDAALRSNPESIIELARVVAVRFFPDSVNDVLSAVGFQGKSSKS